MGRGEETEKNKRERAWGPSGWRKRRERRVREKNRRDRETVAERGCGNGGGIATRLGRR